MNDIQPENLVRENIEWCKVWIPDSARSELDLPRVLLVGDSIVVDYGPFVAECLTGDASVAWIGTSRFPTDPVFREEVHLVLRHTRFDLIYFNNGLHGFGNSEESYQTGLLEVFTELRQASRGASWMLASSTPKRVRGRLHEWHERLPRIQLRNRMIERIARQTGLPFVDLYSLVLDHPEYYTEDGVHFNELGRAAQAEFAARAIREELNRLAAREGITAPQAASVPVK